MSFLSTIGNVVRGVGNFFRSNSLGANLAKTALYGYALNRVAKSIRKEQDTQDIQDQGRQISVNPDPNNSIPVIYGDAYTSGIITDAYMAGNNKTMWFCLTLSEMTGDLIDGTPSAITFKEVYYNGLRLDFQNDGYTVKTAYDDAGNSTNNYNGLVRIYPFVGDSNSPTGFTTEIASNTASAYSLFPTWDANDDMSDLVFVLIQITYSPKNDISNVGDFKFRISNTMKKPGDVLFDYMTNTRYGAGIPEAEISKS